MATDALAHSRLVFKNDPTESKIQWTTARGPQFFLVFCRLAKGTSLAVGELESSI